MTVENWRNWQGPVTIDGLSHGIVILGGPNAVGKTGLWEAIVAGLLDRHWGSHTDRLRPAGTKRVIPRVEIEFGADGRFFKVEKNFGGGAGRDKASFYERNQNKWGLRDQGEEAYLLCRGTVLGTASTAPGRGGLENAVQGTLLEILLPQQGTLAQKTSTPDAVAVAVTDRTAAAAATHLGRILALVSKETDKWWVGRRDALTKSTDLAHDIERLEKVEEEIKGLEVKVRGIDDLVGRFARATEALAGLGEASQQLDEAEVFDREAREHRQRRDDALNTSNAASSEAQTREGIWQAREECLSHLALREETLRKAWLDLKEKEETLQRAAQIQKDRDFERKKLLSDIGLYRAWINYETRDRRLKELRSSLESVQTRRSTAETCRGEIAGLEREKIGLPLPRPEEWEEWDNIESALQKAEGRLKAGAWIVEGSLPVELSLDVDGERVSGGNVSRQASRWVKIASASGEALRIAAPDGDAAKEVEEHGKAATKFLTRFGVDNIRELRRRHTYVAGTLDQRIAAAVATMKEALQGVTAETLLREEVRIDFEIKRNEGLRVPEEGCPEGNLEEWDVHLQVFQDSSPKSEERVKEAASKLASATKDEERSRSAHTDAQKDHDAALDALSNHGKEHGPDDDVERAAKEAFRMKQEKEAAWKPLEEEREIAEGAKEKRARGLRESLKEIMKQQGVIKGMEGELSEIRREDPEGRLVDLLAERATLEPRVRAGRILADALLLLEGLLKEERDRLTQAIGGPVCQRLQRWARYLFQDSSEVVVGEDGWPRVIRTSSGQDVAYEDQSFGTREQVGVLYRLAVADLLAESTRSGVCLMLDDPFGHTDRGRRRRILEILQAEVEKRGHQVLLFTCRPEDFEGIGRHISVGI